MSEGNVEINKYRYFPIESGCILYKVRPLIEGGK